MERGGAAGKALIPYLSLLLIATLLNADENIYQNRAAAMLDQAKDWWIRLPESNPQPEPKAAA